MKSGIGTFVDAAFLERSEFMGNETIFRDKPVWTAIFSLAVPSALTILIMVIYNMADMGCMPCWG